MKDDKNMPQEFNESEHNRAQNIYDIQIEFIKRDVQDIKSEARETRKELNAKIDNTRQELSSKIDSNFKWMLSVFGGGFVILLGYMSHLSMLISKLHG